MMPICVICSDPLCRINEISLSEEEVAVWVKCGEWIFRLRYICVEVRLMFCRDRTLLSPPMH